jgi:hypothetical protein
MTDEEWNNLLSKIKSRYGELSSQSRRHSFLDHVRSLGEWQLDAYSDMENMKVSPEFPADVHVAFAVCHPGCGVQEFIVDGSTQECQRCGRLMFRIASSKYVLDTEEISA